jgi:nucleoside-diphosphate-sugar epimerase
MRVAITGGAGFIGRAIVERLVARGDDVVALVRDPAKATHIAGERVTLVANDLSNPTTIEAALAGADVVIHAAGSYRIGIKASERDAMWDSNVSATERVLDTAIAAGAQRIVYVSTNNVFGNTHGRLVDETYRRDVKAGFVSWYDETKYRAHEAAEARIKGGGPIVILQPGQTYGPHDHSEASGVIEQAFKGKLRYVPLPSTGLAWVHVHDVADATVAALDRGRIGEAYSLAGDCHRLGASIGIAARLGGHRPPRFIVPTGLLRVVAPLNDRLGGLSGLPHNLAETIRAGENVTYWAKHAKATAELGFRPRSLEQGIADTWGSRKARSD